MPAVRPSAPTSGQSCRQHAMMCCTYTVLGAHAQRLDVRSGGNWPVEQCAQSHVAHQEGSVCSMQQCTMLAARVSRAQLVWASFAAAIGACITTCSVIETPWLSGSQHLLSWSRPRIISWCTRIKAFSVHIMRTRWLAASGTPASCRPAVFRPRESTALAAAQAPEACQPSSASATCNMSSPPSHAGNV